MKKIAPPVNLQLKLNDENLAELDRQPQSQVRSKSATTDIMSIKVLSATGKSDDRSISAQSREYPHIISENSVESLARPKTFSR